MFKWKQKADEQGYSQTGIHVSTIESGRLTKAKVNGRDVAVTILNDQIIAFSDTCPHGAASLSKGSLSTHKICCSEHGYCFDIRTGNILWPQDEGYRLRLYHVKVVDGQVWLRAKDGQFR